MTSAAGLIIFFAVFAAYLCARAGSSMGAFVFTAVALVLFINTPAGAGLPGGLGHFFESINNTITPELNGSGSADHTRSGR